MRNLKKIADVCATFGPIGYYPFAGVINVLLSIPIVLVVDSLVWAIPWVYPFLYVALFVLTTLILLVTLHRDREEVLPRNVMMINRVLGLLFVFSGIAVNVKLLVVGGVVFLALRHFIPRLLLQYASINLMHWPALIHLLFIDVFAGLSVNFMFRFVFWLVAMPR